MNGLPARPGAPDAGRLGRKIANCVICGTLHDTGA